MLTALALATILQASSQQSASGNATAQGMGAMGRGAAASGNRQRGQGDANVRRNGRRYGSIGMPAASAIVDGERLAGGAVVVNGRVFVEMIPVFQRLGVRTTYHRGDKKIEAFTQDRGISFTIGDTYAMLPNRTKMDAAPMLQGDKVFIPARAMSQAFRADVRWDKGTRTVYITSSPKTRRNGATGGDSVGGLGAGSTGGGRGNGGNGRGGSTGG